MKLNLKILTSYWFLFGLLVILLNDFVLKGMYGNWITGKLSDFAGIFVFSIFWCAIFPKARAWIFWVVGILFVFWKSSYSQSFIDGWNSISMLQISRVVDYSDLLALLVLPIASEFNRRKESIQTFKLHPVIPLMIAAFSFGATSNPAASVDFNETFDFPISKTELIRKINAVNFSDSLLNNEELSMYIQNSNDYRVDVDHADTSWFYASAYDTIYDTMFVYKTDIFGNGKLTNKIDTIREYIYPTRDSIYIDQAGNFFYQNRFKGSNPRTKLTYFYNETSKLRIEGNGNSSSLTLLEFRDVEYLKDIDAKKRELLRDFKLYFIEKIRKMP
ncbi:MAG: hypothetical protein ACI837_001473 [Crocinitomicaceae bacterium]